MYTREEILMESEFDASMERIDTMSMMMLENFAIAMECAESEEVFEEATESIGKTMMSKVSSIIAKIRQYIQDTISKIRDMHQKRQINKLMSPEFKEAVKALDNGKLKNKKVPDVVKLAKLATASEKYIDKTIAAYNKEMSKFLSAVSAADKSSRKNSANKVSSEKFVDFCKNMTAGYQKIEDEVDKAYNAKIPLTKDYLIKMVQAGINSEEDFKDIEKKLKAFESSMNDAIKGAVSSINTAAKQGFGFKVNKSFGEGVEDLLNEMDDSLLMEESVDDDDDNDGLIDVDALMEEVELEDEDLDDVEESAEDDDESGDDVFEEKKSDSGDELEKTSFFAKVNVAISNATSSVANFFRKHGKLILKITTALAAVAALIFGGKAAVKYANKVDKDLANARVGVQSVNKRRKSAERIANQNLYRANDAGELGDSALVDRLKENKGRGNRMLKDAMDNMNEINKKRDGIAYKVGNTFRRKK